MNIVEMARGSARGGAVLTTLSIIASLLTVIRRRRGWAVRRELLD